MIKGQAFMSACLSMIIIGYAEFMEYSVSLVRFRLGLQKEPLPFMNKDDERVGIFLNKNRLWLEQYMQHKDVDFWTAIQGLVWDFEKELSKYRFLEENFIQLRKICEDYDFQSIQK